MFKNSKARRMRFLLAGASFLAVAMVATVLWKLGDDRNNGRSPAPLACVFEPGQARSYDFELEAESKLNARAVMPTSDPRQQPSLDAQRVTMRGLLHMRAIVVADGVATLGVEFELDSTVGVADAELIEQITRPFAVTIDRTCRFRDFGFANDVAPAARNQLRGMLQSSQVVLHPASAQPSWRALEHDLSGKYWSQYHLEDANARRVSKIKSGYIHVYPGVITDARGATEPDESLSIRVRASTMSAVVDAAGVWMAQVSGTERLVLSTDGQLLADVTVQLKVAVRDHAERRPLPDLKALAWTSGIMPAERMAKKQPEPPARFKTLPLDEAMEMARAMLRDNPDAHATVGYMLAQLLRAQPQLAAELVALVRDGEVANEMHSAVFFGLERAGTPEARTVLIESVADAALQPENRMRAAVALPDIDEPNDEALAALVQMSRVGAGLDDASQEQQLRNAASFGVGTLEHNVRTSHPQLAETARQAIREQLAAGDGPVEVTAALDAIHNSGHPSFANELAPFFESDSELVRQHAYGAVKRMPPEATEDLFAGLLDGEKGERQRAFLAVTFADQAKLAKQPPPDKVWSAAVSRLGDEGSPLVRASYVHLVGAAAASSAAAVDALAKQYGEERDPRMLKAIGQYVPANKLP